MSKRRTMISMLEFDIDFGATLPMVAAVGLC